MEDFLVVVLVILLIFALFLGIALAGAYGISKPSCTNTLETMGVDGTWSFWAGCLVNTDDFGIIPLDQYVFVLTGK